LKNLRVTFPTLQAIETDISDTSKAYQVPGYKGRIGFITSMSDHFCGTCNRLRITADGNLKVCLFGNSEVSLRDLVRSGVNDEKVKTVIQAAGKMMNFHSLLLLPLFIIIMIPMYHM